MKTLRKFSIPLSILIMSASATTFAQPYPTVKPVRIVAATQPGTSTDVIARLFADGLSRNTNHRFLVENRGGGGGNIGLSFVAKSVPDGYTLALGNLGGSILNQYMYPSLDFDPEKDFEPIVLIAGLPFVIAVNADYPAKNLQDLINMAKAKPGEINVALDSSSVRAANALLAATSGINLFAIQYNGPAAAITDTLSGRVPVIMETLGGLRSLISSGKLRAIAVTTLRTSELLPGVNSVAEQGLPGFGELTGWVGLIAPKGTPRDVITMLNTEVNKILALPETKQRYNSIGAEIRSGSPKDFADFQAAERARFGPLIKAAGIKAE